MGFSTALKLGLPQVASVMVYKALSTRGWVAGHSATLQRQRLFRSDVNTHRDAECNQRDVIRIADEILAGQFRLFGDEPRALGFPPDWHTSIATGRQGATETPWWRLPDFDPQLGDIKGVWELSRLSWAPALARAAAVTGQVEYSQHLNALVEDWVARNPPFLGLNWKCGQEASFRVLNLMLAACLLGQDGDPEPGLVELVETHLRRISPTIFYAMAQDNNHGTSEAAALFVGGAWTARHMSSRDKQQFANACAARGRRWLENRARRLVLSDGGFSQYSVTYHRLFLDTMVQAETWRARLGLDAFSREFYAQCARATIWLATMTNAQTGDAPNLGSNDSANLFRVDGGFARDFRPSVQTASQTFAGTEIAFRAVREKTSQVMPDFGVALLNPRAEGSGAYAFLRFPNFRFRPGQADFLHFDLWTDDGLNLLRDAGSYSYADDTGSREFSSISAHNSVQFDGREPMRKLTRFLYGDWVRGTFDSAVHVDASSLRFAAGYRDYLGAIHQRTVSAQDDTWTLVDRVSGFKSTATLRWRLAPAPWSLMVDTVTGPRLSMTVRANTSPIRLGLTHGWESRDYLSKSEVSVFEAEFGRGTTEIITTIKVLPA